MSSFLGSGQPDAHFISRRLRSLREQLDLTQEQFSAASAINYKVYQSMEVGRRWNLRWSTILKVAELHRLSVSQFFAIVVPRSHFTPPVRPLPVRRRKKK